MRGKTSLFTFQENVDNADVWKAHPFDAFWTRVRSQRGEGGERGREGGGGGSLPLEAVPDARERKKRGKRVSKSGVGAESADREKGIKITDMTENGKMVFKLLWSEFSRAIIRGKGR